MASPVKRGRVGTIKMHCAYEVAPRGGDQSACVALGDFGATSFALQPSARRAEARRAKDGGAKRGRATTPFKSIKSATYDVLVTVTYIGSVTKFQGSVSSLH